MADEIVAEGPLAFGSWLLALGCWCGGSPTHVGEASPDCIRIEAIIFCVHPRASAEKQLIFNLEGVAELLRSASARRMQGSFTSRFFLRSVALGSG